MGKDKAAQSVVDNMRKNIGEHTHYQNVKVEKRMVVGTSRTELNDGSTLILKIFAFSMILLSGMIAYLTFTSYTQKTEL